MPFILHNNSSHLRRPTSIRLTEAELTFLKKQCSQYGISVNTALRWLINRAVKEGKIEPPKEEKQTSI